jgi:hypothetical protein
MTSRHTAMPRFVALVGALAFLAVSPAVDASPPGQSRNFPARIDLPNGFFPEGIESGPGTSFFVGSLQDGAIWRGDLRTGSGSVLAAGAPGLASAGIAYEAARDRIWVAGVGPPLHGRADVRVYDASSGAVLATYAPLGVGLLNDVAAEFDLGGVNLGYPDGLELLGHTLYVVRPFQNRVTVVSLGAQLTGGVVLGDLIDPSFDIPSTATVAAGRLWAVNLRFTTPPEPTTPYWITQLPLRP